MIVGGRTFFENYFPLKLLTMILIGSARLPFGLVFYLWKKISLQTIALHFCCAAAAASVYVPFNWLYNK